MSALRMQLIDKLEAHHPRVGQADGAHRGHQDPARRRAGRPGGGHGGGDAATAATWPTAWSTRRCASAPRRRSSTSCCARSASRAATSSAWSRGVCWQRRSRCRRRGEDGEQADDQGLRLERHRRAGRHGLGARPRLQRPAALDAVIADSRIENGQPADRIGCIRNFRLRDGGVIRERLLALSDYDYQCTYAILESPMGVDNYVATLKLTPVTDGNRTFAEWSAEFDCAAGARARAVRADRQRRVPGRLRRAEAPFVGADRATAPVSRRVDAAGRPLDRDRRADRARLGGAARLQQPRRPGTPWSPRAGDRGRRARRPGRLRAQLHAEGRQPHPRAAARALRQRAHVAPTASSTRRVPLQRYVATVHAEAASPTATAPSGTGSRPSTTPRGRERELPTWSASGLRGRLRGPAPASCGGGAGAPAAGVPTARRWPPQGVVVDAATAAPRCCS